MHSRRSTWHLRSGCSKVFTKTGASPKLLAGWTGKQNLKVAIAERYSYAPRTSASN
jgi:hypothetical protein